MFSRINILQDLLPTDYLPREQFVRWCMKEEQVDEHFLKYFTSPTNPVSHAPERSTHITSPTSNKANPMQCIGSTTSIGSALMCGLVLSATVLLGHIWCLLLSVDIYETFLMVVLPEMLKDVPLAIRRRMWIQYDGAPSHFHQNDRQFLNNVFKIGG